jgi:hypothetical protein
VAHGDEKRSMIRATIEMRHRQVQPVYPPAGIGRKRSKISNTARARVPSRAVRDHQNSCIDKLRRRGVDARESAADRAAGIGDGEGSPRQRERREFVDHAVRPEARNDAAPLRLDGCKAGEAVKVRRGGSPNEGEHEARPCRHIGRDPRRLERLDVKVLVLMDGLAEECADHSRGPLRLSIIGTRRRPMRPLPSATGWMCSNIQCESTWRTILVGTRIACKREIAPFGKR